MIVHTDGGSRGNPGHAATGFVVLQDGGELIHEEGQYLGIATNNTAEYEAVVRALTWIIAQKGTLFPTPQPVTFKLDSQLVVEQLNGRYAIKQPHILVYAKKIRELVGSLGFPVTFHHIPRSENSRADALVNQALDAHKLA